MRALPTPSHNPSPPIRPSAMRAASVAIWGITLATYAAMAALPRRLSGCVVFLAAFAFLIFCHATSLDASAWRRGDIDFTGTLMIVTLKLVGAAMDCQDGSQQPDGREQDGKPPPAAAPSTPRVCSALPIRTTSASRSCTNPHALLSPHPINASPPSPPHPFSHFLLPTRPSPPTLILPPPPPLPPRLLPPFPPFRPIPQRASSASPSALPRVPPLLPFLGFVFFPAALLVGPPFPLAAYHDYIEGQGVRSVGRVVGMRGGEGWDGWEGREGWEGWRVTSALLVGPPFPLAAYQEYVEAGGEEVGGGRKGGRACRALVKALLCMALYHSRSLLLPPSALTQPAFFTRPFLIRAGQVALTLFAYRWMFYFIWAVAESALILSAFGFSGFKPAETGHGAGKDGEGRDGEGGQRQQQQQRLEADWSRASNVNMWVVEVTGSGAQLPSHWNIGVSNWLRTYVYDRMTPPSGKPTLTTLLVTQAVSALWHGLHPGYYLFFLSAAIAQDASKLLHRLHQSIPPHRRWQRGMAWVAQMLYTRMLVGYAPLGFILLRADLTFTVWRSLYFFGSILPLLLSALLPPLIPPSNRRKKEQ
ncbi:unnamed protein product [Closterium sp. Yama58-4]|nr:unnamed protein product [Closterium sp. Yama58-4]